LQHLTRPAHAQVFPAKERARGLEVGLVLEAESSLDMLASIFSNIKTTDFLVEDLKGNATKLWTYLTQRQPSRLSGDLYILSE
jgi:hypothetical protein